MCNCGCYELGEPDWNSLWVSCGGCGGWRLFSLEGLVREFPEGVPRRGIDFLVEDL